MKRSSWNSWINVYLLGVLLSKSVVGQEDSSASTVLATLHDLELQDEIPEDLITLTGILQSKNFSQIYAIGGNDQRGFSDFAILPPDQPNSEYDPSAAKNTRSTIEPLFIRVSILKLQPYEEEMAELLPPSGPFQEFQSIEDPVPSYNIDGPEEPILEINEERNQQEQISSKQDGGIMEKIIFQTTDSYVEITNQQPSSSYAQINFDQSHTINPFISKEVLKPPVFVTRPPNFQKDDEMANLQGQVLGWLTMIVYFSLTGGFLFFSIIRCCDRSYFRGTCMEDLEASNESAIREALRTQRPQTITRPGPFNFYHEYTRRSGGYEKI